MAASSTHAAVPAEGFHDDCKSVLGSLPNDLVMLMPQKHGKHAFTVRSPNGCSIAVNLSQKYMRIEKCGPRVVFDMLPKKNWSFAKAHTAEEAWALAKDAANWDSV